jgi:hypothetical protein
MQSLEGGARKSSRTTAGGAGGGRTCSAGCTAAACPGRAPRRSQAPGAGWRARGVRTRCSGAARGKRSSPHSLAAARAHTAELRERAARAPGTLSRSASCAHGPRRRRGRGEQQSPARSVPLHAPLASAAIPSPPRRWGPERPPPEFSDAARVKLRTAVGLRARKTAPRRPGLRPNRARCRSREPAPWRENPTTCPASSTCARRSAQAPPWCVAARAASSGVARVAAARAPGV